MEFHYTNKKIIFTLALLFLIVPLINAADSLGTFKQNQEMQITNFCASADCTFANLTSIKTPNGSITHLNSLMTKTENEFNYSYTPTELGTYVFKTCSNPEGEDYCESDTFEVTSTGEGGSMFFLILITSIAVIFLIASLFAPEEFFVYISGSCFLIGGIYLMINGIDVLNNTNTRYLAFIYLGIGLLFSLGAYIYNLWSYEKDSYEEY